VPGAPCCALCFKHTHAHTYYDPSYSAQEQCIEASTQAQIRSPPHCPLLAARALLAVFAARPAARSPHPRLQLLLRPADPACACLRELCIYHPAHELVAGQGGEGPPSTARLGAPHKCPPQVRRELVHHTTRDTPRAHRAHTLHAVCCGKSGAKTFSKLLLRTFRPRWASGASVKMDAQCALHTLNPFRDAPLDKAPPSRSLGSQPVGGTPMREPV